MYCAAVFSSARRQRRELGAREKVKLASGSGAQRANKVKYYHNASDAAAVIGGENTGSGK